MNKNLETFTVLLIAITMMIMLITVMMMTAVRMISDELGKIVSVGRTGEFEGKKDSSMFSHF